MFVFNGVGEDVVELNIGFFFFVVGIRVVRNRVGNVDGVVYFDGRFW